MADSGQNPGMIQTNTLAYQPPVGSLSQGFLNAHYLPGACQSLHCHDNSILTSGQKHPFKSSMNFPLHQAFAFLVKTEHPVAGMLDLLTSSLPVSKHTQSTF